ncbi:MAG: hypothetical protein Q8755_02100 [Candidatus Phytoplasma australasiaticum]|uniref:Uncharacterized protein n=2 Tax=Candidatus Phytoplasma australasiaticum subsp. australasiaticum TaxID=2832407 RepID=A0A9K3SU11_9MOLU|nr:MULTISPECIES: hypothetical protein [Phytoplasma]MDV3155056.1 hypothetical protein [Sweet potato little leaf phytoplasma]MDO8031007.1 hypothetical protein [Candidatus Phytoplasma australasiaticum]MDO8031525.1 hypothetical protein [Candidatus Phytoplasma australasiaticum]MDO8046567.1 hypothetical protein [Candidatus Phytoplasma australasiaticum]MDO8053123.1 hypothetical protein [Candidatus Phytoplasma australasiaticum]
MKRNGFQKLGLRIMEISGFENAQEIQEAGISLEELKEAGYSDFQLLNFGYPQKQLIKLNKTRRH